jgi:photosystem II stability/assembly factor-like uncharacterized protein
MGSGEAGLGSGGSPVLAEWADATGDLVGRTTSGPITYVSVKPDEDRMIAGIEGFGLFKSDDGGDSWTGLGQSGMSDPITNLVMQIIYDPEDPDIFWEIGIYGASGGVYKTEDGGETIERLGDVTHIDWMAIDFNDPDRKTLVAGKHEAVQSVSRSTDGGETWDHTFGANITSECGFSSFPLVIDTDTCLVGCINMIVRTADGGANWETVSTTGGDGPPLLASDGTIYWLNSSGLMRSEDEGETWNRVLGANVLRKPPIELPDGRLAAIGQSRVMVSSDRGESWSPVTADLPFDPLGMTYSPHRKEILIWISVRQETIPSDSIMRYPWDHETE